MKRKTQFTLNIQSAIFTPVFIPGSTTNVNNLFSFVVFFVECWNFCARCDCPTTRRNLRRCFLSTSTTSVSFCDKCGFRILWRCVLFESTYMSSDVFEEFCCCVASYPYQVFWARVQTPSGCSLVRGALSRMPIWLW